MLHATVYPDFKRYPNLKYPPFFADLEFENAAGYPELRIDGYIGNALKLSRSFSSDQQQDKFLLEVDDGELFGNGSDATPIAFRVTDKFGAPRAFGGGAVSFEVTGPGTIVGNNPSTLEKAAEPGLFG